jgi:hypothetical protein
VKKYGQTMLGRIISPGQMHFPYFLGRPRLPIGTGESSYIAVSTRASMASSMGRNSGRLQGNRRPL